MQNEENFTKLPSEAKELLEKEDYDIKKDPNNILKIYPSDNRKLEAELNKIRIKSAREKFNL